MAKVYANGSGALLRLSANEQQEDLHGGAPAGTTATLAFDEETNAALVQDIIDHFSAYTIVSGALQKNGSPVAIASPGTHYAARQQLTAAKQTIQGNAANLQSYHDAASPTNAQTVAAVKLVIEDIQAMVILLRALIREAN